MTTRYAKTRDRLQAGEVLILDGGVSSELEKRGVPMTDGLWSGRVALDHWEAVVDMHRAYIDAGADIITANTYASSRLMLGPAGLGDKVDEINRRSIDAALEARRRAGTPDLLVAGSMSHMIPIPTGAYRPEEYEHPGAAAMLDAFRELAMIHADAGSDFILLEMMSAPERMAPMFHALSDTNLPVWCGLSAVRDDEGAVKSWHEPSVPFADIVAMAAAQEFDVMGIMHTSADLIADTLPVIRAAHAGPVMAYPDAGYFEMPHWRFVDTIAPSRFRELAEAWRDAGVQILGGCCGLGPEHIAAIADMKGSPRR
ncbi:MAG: homocysteine S-methyltransferase family protein [Rhodospirillales bacterium]|nr:homocysteine S-methyltransferase family protein [Rhodospirillales bacterium]